MDICGLEMVCSSNFCKASVVAGHCSFSIPELGGPETGKRPRSDFLEIL